jgi:hypothetical protein
MPYAAKYANDKPTWEVIQDCTNGRWFVLAYVRLHGRYEPYEDKDYATEDEAWDAVQTIVHTRNANATR